MKSLFSDEPRVIRPILSIMFEKYDVDQTGTINSVKIQNMMYDYGSYLTLNQIKELFGEVKMNYEEFIVWWRGSIKFSAMKLNDPMVKKIYKLSQVFREFDLKCRGKVSWKHFKEIHLKINTAERCFLPDVSICLSRLDPASTGYISFNAFIDFCGKNMATTNSMLTKQSAFTKIVRTLKSLSTKPSDAEVDMIPAREHPDYFDFFNMFKVGGNINVIRSKMRTLKLDETLLNTPEKLIYFNQKYYVPGNNTDFHNTVLIEC